MPPSLSRKALFGLEAPIRVLWNALAEDRACGSYMLKGPMGVGKTALALAFGKAAACLAPNTQPYDACDDCASCRRATAGTQPEIVLVRPSGAQTQIWQFWDREGKPPGLLERTLAFAPTIGARRVYIIERADTLNEAAANSLLKVLEEPPPYAVFLLLTPNVDRVLPTVRSRCQTITLRPADQDALAVWIAERYGLPDGRAMQIAALAEGRTGAAVELASDENAIGEIRQCADVAIQLARSSPLEALRAAEAIRKVAAGLEILGVSAAGNMEQADSASGAGKQRIDRGRIGVVLDILASAFRDILVLSLDAGAHRIIHEDHRAALADCAHGSSSRRWIAAIDAIVRARRRLERNVSPQLVTDWLAMATADQRSSS